MIKRKGAALLVGVAALLVTTLFLMAWVAMTPQVGGERTLPGPIPSWWLDGEPPGAE